MKLFEVLAEVENVVIFVVLGGVFEIGKFVLVELVVGFFNFSVAESESERS